MQCVLHTPSFRLAGVANERINSGHAQLEREEIQALQTVGAGCLDEWRVHRAAIALSFFNHSVSPNIYHYILYIDHLKEVF